MRQGMPPVKSSARDNAASRPSSEIEAPSDTAEVIMQSLSSFHLKRLPRRFRLLSDFRSPLLYSRCASAPPLFSSVRNFLVNMPSISFSAVIVYDKGQVLRRELRNLTANVNTLLFVIIQSKDAPNLSNALRAMSVAFTLYPSRGSFLDIGNTTYMIGTDKETVPAILECVREHSQQRDVLGHGGHVPLHPDFYASPTTISVGGAIIFAVPVEQFVHL